MHGRAGPQTAPPPLQPWWCGWTQERLPAPFPIRPWQLHSARSPGVQNATGCEPQVFQSFTILSNDARWLSCIGVSPAAPAVSAAGRSAPQHRRVQHRSWLRARPSPAARLPAGLSVPPRRRSQSGRHRAVPSPSGGSRCGIGRSQPAASRQDMPARKSSAIAGEAASVPESPHPRLKSTDQRRRGL